MTDELTDRLNAIATRVENWRAEAARIRALADQTLQTHQVETDRLLEVEETAGEIYREIDLLKATITEFPDPGVVATARIAQIGDDLRLVLMEITEQGTSMYSVRSLEPEDAATKAVSPDQAAPPPPVT